MSKAGYTDLKHDVLQRIGYFIVEKRREFGYTRADLERLSGISQYTIRNIELPSVKLEKGPSIETLIPILEALGIHDPVGRLLGDSK